MSGLELVRPQETTLAEELHRLRRAVEGTPTRAGLASILSQLADRPYQVLRASEQWTDREHARRIDPTRLVQAFSRPGNLATDRLPLVLPERPVNHDVDTYENRLVKAFFDQVNVRVRLAFRAVQGTSDPALAEEAASLLRKLTGSRLIAPFLDRVGELTEPPGRITMVLLKRSEYRAALEGLLEFRRSSLVRIREPAIEAPLENIPHLYETWGVMTVVKVLLELATDLGYTVANQSLSSYAAGQVWIRVLPNGIPAVVLEAPTGSTEVRLIPQCTYGRTAPLRSVSFDQRPDVAVEVRQNNQTAVYIFDPKYKLRSEDSTVEEPTGKPKKTDIDAMHSYRDSIRDSDGRRAVCYAAILYPGPTKIYMDGLSALQAQPTHPEALERDIRQVLSEALSAPA